MKKILALCLGLSLLLCSCTSAPNSSSSAEGTPSSGETSSQPESSSAPTATKAISQKADGIIYTITKAEIAESEGVRQLSITMQIENTTDQAFGYLEFVDLALPDGFVLSQDATNTTMDLLQVPSNSKREITVLASLAEDLTVNSVNLVYDHMDYSQEYWQDIGKAITGEFTEKDFNKKYSPKELTFEIPVPYQA